MTTSLNLSLVSKFIREVSDLKIRMHPKREDVLVIFNKLVENVYSDVFTEVIDRIPKSCILQKIPDLSYVNYVPGELIEDAEELPWTVVLTMHNLPRVIEAYDQIRTIDNLYTVSKVYPINRNSEGVLQFFVFPERTDLETFDFVGVRVEDSVVAGPLSIVIIPLYTGFPQFYKLERPISGGDVDWREFKSMRLLELKEAGTWSLTLKYEEVEKTQSFEIEPEPIVPLNLNRTSTLQVNF